MQGQTNAFAKTAANTLRKSMTDAEKKLWHRLRGEQLGVKFRRQHPSENDVLDFVFLDKRVVIEVDGPQHVDAAEYDEKRTQILHAADFQVLRFWNNEVLNETDGVLQGIVEALNPSLPQPQVTCPASKAIAHTNTLGLAFTASANAGENNESD